MDGRPRLAGKFLLALCSVEVAVGLAEVAFGAVVLGGIIPAEDIEAASVGLLPSAVDASLTVGLILVTIGASEAILYGLGVRGALNPSKIRPFLFLFGLMFLMELASAVQAVAAHSAGIGNLKVLLAGVVFASAVAVSREAD